MALTYPVCSFPWNDKQAVSLRPDQSTYGKLKIKPLLSAKLLMKQIALSYITANVKTYPGITTTTIITKILKKHLLIFELYIFIIQH